MPHSLSVRLRPRVAHVRLSGALAPDDIRAACSDLLSCPDWTPGTPQVWDFSDVDGLVASQAEWDALLGETERRYPRFGDNRSVAITTHPQIEGFLYAYAHRFRGTGRAFHIAPSHGDAVDWLLEENATA